MLRLASLLLVLSLAVPSTAAAQATDRPIRAGTYDLAITFGGGTLEATLVIGYKGDTISAVLNLGDRRTGDRARAWSPVSL